MSYNSQTQIINNHDYTDTYTVEYSSNQTGTVLLTPSSNHRIQITDVKIETKATTGQVKIYDDVSLKSIAILNAENPGSGEYHMRFIGAKDGSIKLTSTTGANSVFIVINFKEVTEPTGLTSSTSTSTTTS